MKASTLLVVALLAVSVASQSVAKSWPNQWSSEFSEEMKLPYGTGITKGKWSYDFTNKRFRVDRADGKFDRYCGINWYIFRSTPCNQYVVEGWRYLHYPEKKYCCKCCHASNGCGIVTPNWFQKGTYVGKRSFSNTEDVEEWNTKGLQDNIYAQTTKTLRPARIFQSPQSDMVFDTATYKEGVDSSVFKLPAECGNTMCPAMTVCGLARRETMTE